MKDYYRILNIERDATDADIKRSFRMLCKKYHPDVNGGDAVTQQKFEDVNEANAVLSDPAKRADYDAHVNAAEAAVDNAVWQGDLPPTVMQIPELADEILISLEQNFKTGYIDGYGDAAAKMQKAITALEEKVKSLSRDNLHVSAEFARASRARTELEHELQERSKQLEQNSDLAEDLANRLRWIKQATTADATSKRDALKDKSADVGSAITKLTHELEYHGADAENVELSSLAQQERRKEIRQTLDALDVQVKRLSEELDEIRETEEQNRKLTDTDFIIRSMEEYAAEWSKKVRADKKLADRTLYGDLGVTVWATTAELDAAFERLSARISSSADDDAEEQLKKIKHAYSVLITPKRRDRYNKKLGFSDEMIAAERKLIAENARVQKEFHEKLETRAFWAKFDELCSLALNGDAEAQNALGEMYYRGTEIGRDFSHAVFWFCEAFEQGDPSATYNLGICYCNGQGVDKNLGIAKALFRQARNLGYIPTGALRTEKPILTDDQQ